MDDPIKDVEGVEATEIKEPTVIMEVAGILTEMKDIRKELINGELNWHDMFE